MAPSFLPDPIAPVQSRSATRPNQSSSLPDLHIMIACLHLQNQVTRLIRASICHFKSQLTTAFKPKTVVAFNPQFASSSQSVAAKVNLNKLCPRPVIPNKTSPK
ncbi:hypothetical protein ACLB2K_011797 [Fragaria x ananassa]